MAIIGWRAAARALLTGSSPVPPAPPAQADEAIGELRAAANRLSLVAESVKDRAELTVRQVIDQATDEAARFDA